VGGVVYKECDGGNKKIKQVERYESRWGIVKKKEKNGKGVLPFKPA
jgi:hypothetical protein